jgi:hypothetical protein
MPLLGTYAAAFFVLPCCRALWARGENGRIASRNAARKKAASEALAAALVAVEDGRAAAAARLRAPLLAVQGEP